MKILSALSVQFFFISTVHTEPEQADSLATADLAEIDRKLNNPLTSIWSLTFQNNTAIKEAQHWSSFAGEDGSVSRDGRFTCYA